MKKKLLFIFTILITLIFNLFCEETVDAKAELNKATNYYNSDNYINALEYYVKAVQAEESNTGTTYYRLAYSWENVNPNASKYFSKFYSIAAYCFERDNDTENKYYSYSINKEEKYNTSHNNLNEKRIKSIISNDLTQKKIDYKKDKEDKKSDAPVIILALIIGLFCTAKFGGKSGKNSPSTNTQTGTQRIKYYCKYCGIDKNSVRELTLSNCGRYPNGSGKHEVYQGPINNEYQCQYCGDKKRTIWELTNSMCPRHPLGAHKGRHSVYEGSPKNEYVCKYCGTKKRTIWELSLSDCSKNNEGIYLRKHVPMK